MGGDVEVVVVTIGVLVLCGQETFGWVQVLSGTSRLLMVEAGRHSSCVFLKPVQWTRISWVEVQLQTATDLVKYRSFGNFWAFVEELEAGREGFFGGEGELSK